MSRGVNKVILIGHLGSNPETRYMPSGGAITTVNLATSEGWKDKTTGEPQERTEWHRLTFFNRLGEIAGQYLKKGSKIYVEGSLRTDKWQDNNGNDRYMTKIIVSNMQMLDSKGDGNSNQNANYQQAQSNAPMQNQNNAPMQNQNNAPMQNQNQNNAPVQNQNPAPAQSQSAPPDMGFDDDIPF